MTLNKALARAVITAIEEATGQTIGHASSVLGVDRRSLHRSRRVGMTAAHAALLLHRFNSKHQGNVAVGVVPILHDSSVGWSVIRGLDVAGATTGSFTYDPTEVSGGRLYS